MLADELDKYKGRRNKYVDDNIEEIQELYKDDEQRKDLKGKERQDEEVLLFKLYEESTHLDNTKSSFIQDKINNLKKYIKFVQSSTKTRIFNPLSHYKLI